MKTKTIQKTDRKNCAWEWKGLLSIAVVLYVIFASLLISNIVASIVSNSNYWFLGISLFFLILLTVAFSFAFSPQKRKKKPKEIEEEKVNVC